LRAGLIVAVAAVIAGCGGSPETDPLADGIARGPGFTMELTEDWEAVSDLEALSDEVSSSEDLPPGLDLDNGILIAGAWGREDLKRTVVTAVIEPVTTDTSLEDVTASATALLVSTGRVDGEVDSRRTTVDGRPATVGSYSDGEGTEHALVALQEGPFAYSLTFQMDTTDPAELQAVVDDILADTRLRPPSESEAEELDSLSDIAGDGYDVSLPAGWKASDGEALGDQPLVADVDTLWRGFIDERFATNVQVRVVPDPGVPLERATEILAGSERRALERAWKAVQVSRGDDLTIDGEPASTLEFQYVAGGIRLSGIEIFVLNESRLHSITLTTPTERLSKDRSALLEGLGSWTWT
jgi:hypothetical protein